jgi:hypothetical protein
MFVFSELHRESVVLIGMSDNAYEAFLFSMFMNREICNAIAATYSQLAQRSKIIHLLTGFRNL